MLRIHQFALVLVLSIGPAYAVTCDPNTCPQYVRKLSLAQNIHIFRGAGMPAIGVCSRIEIPAIIKGVGLNTDDRDEISSLFDPEDLKSTDCLSRILWQSGKACSKPQLTRQLKVLRTAFAYAARQNPIGAHFRSTAALSVPRGLFVCLLMTDLDSQSSTTQCENYIQYFDDERDRLPHLPGRVD